MAYSRGDNGEVIAIEWRENGDTGMPCKIFEKVQNRSGDFFVTPTPPAPSPNITPIPCILNE